MTSQQQSTTALDQAIAAFIARKDRSQHPDGEFDNKRRWYPSNAERQSCCAAVRTPSAAYPFSLMVHCRTADHIANLYGVDAADIRRATRKARPAQRLGGEFFKSVARAEDGRLLSIFDGTTEYRIGETLVQRVGRNHEGGYYVRRTPEGALAADVPSNSALADAERVVVKVRAEGQYTVYKCFCDECSYSYYGQKPADHDKIAFSRVTPIEIVSL